MATDEKHFNASSTHLPHDGTSGGALGAFVGGSLRAVESTMGRAALVGGAGNKHCAAPANALPRSGGGGMRSLSRGSSSSSIHDFRRNSTGAHAAGFDGERPMAVPDAVGNLASSAKGRAPRFVPATEHRLFCSPDNDLQCFRCSSVPFPRLQHSSHYQEGVTGLPAQPEAAQKLPLQKLPAQDLQAQQLLTRNLPKEHLPPEKNAAAAAAAEVGMAGGSRMHAPGASLCDLRSHSPGFKGAGIQEQKPDQVNSEPPLELKADKHDWQPPSPTPVPRQAHHRRTRRMSSEPVSWLDRRIEADEGRGRRSREQEMGGGASDMIVRSPDSGWCKVGGLHLWSPEHRKGGMHTGVSRMFVVNGGGSSHRQRGGLSMTMGMTGKPVDAGHMEMNGSLQFCSAFDVVEAMNEAERHPVACDDITSSCPGSSCSKSSGSAGRQVELISPKFTHDRFRRNFLHARRPMLAACAARLRGSTGMVWVDLGGGTAENVDMMAEFIDLSAFDKIYVVDITPSLCRVAEQKVKQRGWTNVVIVEGDACAFTPPEKATLVTFSYSLSMIPPFMDAVDAATGYMEEDGIMGVADFFTSAKFDLPNRQHTYNQRWFWRSCFDLDGIDLSPERRQYLEHKLETVYEYNGQGKIPYVPYLRAPFYIWVGRRRDCQKVNLVRFPARAADDLEFKIPPGFPPTFLYSLSWEDPREDDKVLDINPSDTILTLTSGGCNALDLVLQGAGKVVGVDINPAQSYLLELKRAAILRLPFEDVWKMFGEGVHEGFPELLERELVPFLSQGATNFWRWKKYYFRNGIYFHGGMGRLIRAVRVLAKLTRMEKWIDNLVNAPSVETQYEIWTNTIGRWLTRANMFARIFGFFFTNRVVLWFCAGIARGQLRLIRKEDNVYRYVVRCLDSVAETTSLRDSNYFYRCCLTGQFSRNCCPRFLQEPCFNKLKTELAARDCMLISTSFFVEELRARMYTKVILMDHVDWLGQRDIDTLCRALKDQVKPGGRVIWRSASRNPEYAKDIEKAGFKVVQVRSITQQQYMDRVNMYASFYVAIRNGGPENIKIFNEPPNPLALTNGTDAAAPAASS
ncbi:unnamed protein product [Closterium sp. NIES-64]|nr:unnamed protein product [Closterium sp. NIES-64]